MVRTQHFHRRGPGFNHWSGNLDPADCVAWPEKKQKSLLSIHCASVQ